MIFKNNKIVFNQEENLLNDEIASIVTGFKNVSKNNLTELYFKVSLLLKSHFDD